MYNQNKMKNKGRLARYDRSSKTGQYLCNVVELANGIQDKIELKTQKFE